MAITSDDLNAFHNFAEATIASQGADSLQELVDLWAATDSSPQQRQRNISAIQAAIRDMENGDRGRQANAVLDELRSQLRAQRDA